MFGLSLGEEIVVPGLLLLIALAVLLELCSQKSLVRLLATKEHPVAHLVTQLVPALVLLYLLLVLLDTIGQAQLSSRLPTAKPAPAATASPAAAPGTAPSAAATPPAPSAPPATMPPGGATPAATAPPAATPVAVTPAPASTPSTPKLGKDATRELSLVQGRLRMAANALLAVLLVIAALAGLLAHQLFEEDDQDARATLKVLLGALGLLLAIWVLRAGLQSRWIEIVGRRPARAGGKTGWLWYAYAVLLGLCAWLGWWLWTVADRISLDFAVPEGPPPGAAPGKALTAEHFRVLQAADRKASVVLSYRPGRGTRFPRRLIRTRLSIAAEAGVFERIESVDYFLDPRHFRGGPPVRKDRAPGLGFGGADVFRALGGGRKNGFGITVMVWGDTNLTVHVHLRGQGEPVELRHLLSRGPGAAGHGEWDPPMDYYFYDGSRPGGEVLQAWTWKDGLVVYERTEGAPASAKAAELRAQRQVVLSESGPDRWVAEIRLAP
jgi:hypothetical protein